MLSNEFLITSFVVFNFIFYKISCESLIPAHVDNFDDSKKIEEEVLNVLGINKPSGMSPSYSESNSAVNFLWDAYKTINEDVVFSANIKQGERRKRSSLNFVTALDIMELEDCNNIMTFIASNNGARNAVKNIMPLQFNIGVLPNNLILQRAEIKIFKNAISLNNIKSEHILQINVFPTSQDESIRHPIQHTNVLSSYGGWVNIDVTDPFEYWLHKRSYKLGFNFEITTLDGRNLTTEDFGFADTLSEENLRPFLIAYFNGPDINLSTLHHTRSKRSLGHNKRQHFNFNGSCQRLNLTIDFSDLGWQNWIMAPERFDAYFCTGECNFPLGAGMNATNHAIVQTLMHLKHSHLPKPSCAPNKLKSIPVLYHLSKEGSNLKKYQNIVAESCGCQ